MTLFVDGCNCGADSQLITLTFGATSSSTTRCLQQHVRPAARYYQRELGPVLDGRCADRDSDSVDSADGRDDGDGDRRDGTNRPSATMAYNNDRNGDGCACQ